MTAPIYLYPEEKKWFDALSAGLREGWEVELERAKYQDTDQRRSIRASLAHFKSPSLRSLPEKLGNVKTQKELGALASGINMEELPESDVAELFFLLGPETLTYIIESNFHEKMTDDELRSIRDFALVRHNLLEHLSANAS